MFLEIASEIPFQMPLVLRSKIFLGIPSKYLAFYFMHFFGNSSRNSSRNYSRNFTKIFLRHSFRKLSLFFFSEIAAWITLGSPTLVSSQILQKKPLRNFPKISSGISIEIHPKKKMYKYFIGKSFTDSLRFSN